MAEYSTFFVARSMGDTDRLLDDVKRGNYYCFQNVSHCICSGTRLLLLLQELMEHSSIKTTQIHLHLTNSLIRDTLEKVGVRALYE